MTRYFFGLVGVTFILSFYVWQQTQSVRLGYQVDNVRRDCERWEQQNQDLRLRINSLLAMDRLDRVAKEKNLITPTEKNTIFLEK